MQQVNESASHLGSLSETLASGVSAFKLETETGRPASGQGVATLHEIGPRDTRMAA